MANPGSYGKVLVPLDLTDKNRTALAVAGSLAAADGEVVLLHVIEMIDDDSSELTGFYRKLEDRAREAMRLLTDELLGERRVTHHVAFGRRVDEIVRVARDGTADLIVLASHRVERNDPPRDWLTISHRVAILAPCTVLLVK